MNVNNDVDDRPSGYFDTIGLERLSEIYPNPTQIRQTVAENNQELALWTGIWSADGKVLFVGDGNNARRRRTGISVHDRSGKQVNLIPTGEAYSAQVLAVSKDGRIVVTHRKLIHRTRPPSNRKQNDAQREYQVWELK